MNKNGKVSADAFTDCAGMGCTYLNLLSGIGVKQRINKRVEFVLLQRHLVQFITQQAIYLLASLKHNKIPVGEFVIIKGQNIYFFCMKLQT